MSTRSNVGILLREEDLNKTLKWNNNELKTNADYPYLEIYVHFDGYLSGVGAWLKDNLNSYEDVLNYIMEGDRTSAETSYVKCGELWEDDKPILAKNIWENVGEIPNEYYYLWKDDKWYFCRYKDEKWYEL